MTCEDKIIEWKKDFKEYINALSMPRDDYKGIMEYIDELPVTPQEPCKDAISRAEAVRVASGYCHPSNIAEELAKLPPVQPKLTECEDTISRQAVLNKKELVELEDGQSFYCISPEDVETLPSVQPKYNTDEWCHDCKEYDNNRHCCPRLNRVIRNAVEEIKQPKTGHCKDCKYFEYDHFENMGGIPLITAHKVCKRHGLICKTDEDGYCHLWEHKAESEVQDAGSN